MRFRSFTGEFHIYFTNLSKRWIIPAKLNDVTLRTARDGARLIVSPCRGRDGPARRSHCRRWRYRARTASPPLSGSSRCLGGSFWCAAAPGLSCCWEPGGRDDFLNKRERVEWVWLQQCEHRGVWWPCLKMMACCEGCIHCTHLLTHTHPPDDATACYGSVNHWDGFWQLAFKHTEHTTSGYFQQTRKRQQEPSETLISVITISSHEASTSLDFHLCFLQMLWLCWCLQLRRSSSLKGARWGVLQEEAWGRTQGTPRCLPKCWWVEIIKFIIITQLTETGSPGLTPVAGNTPRYNKGWGMWRTSMTPRCNFGSNFTSKLSKCGACSKVNSPVEVLGAADGHQAVRVGQFGEAADLVVFLKGGSHSHDEDGGRGGWFTCETPENQQWRFKARSHTCLSVYLDIYERWQPANRLTNRLLSLSLAFRPETVTLKRF